LAEQNHLIIKESSSVPEQCPRSMVVQRTARVSPAHNLWGQQQFPPL